MPWYAAWRITQLVGGKVRFVRASSGHIAGIINHPAGRKGAYWVNEAPAAGHARGLAGGRDPARRQLVDRLDRLARRALGQEGRSRPRVGSEAHPPLADAPGTYVLEK